MLAVISSNCSSASPLQTWIQEYGYQLLFMPLGVEDFFFNWGEKQSLLTRYKGGATEHCLPMEGIIEILQSFGEGDARLISGWYNKKPPTPSLDNRYSDWSQTWQSLHGWQYTNTHSKKKKKLDISSGQSVGWLFLSTFARLSWNLECWFFAEGGKQEDPQKTPWNKDES